MGSTYNNLVLGADVMGKVLVAIAIDDEQASILENIAKKKGVSIGELIEDALKLLLETERIALVAKREA